MGFITKVLGSAWPSWRQVRQEINGTLGLVLYEGDAIRAAVTFGYEGDGSLGDIYIMRNPEKLGGLTSEISRLHCGRRVEQIYRDGGSPSAIPRSEEPTAEL